MMVAPESPEDVFFNLLGSDPAMKMLGNAKCRSFCCVLSPPPPLSLSLSHTHKKKLLLCGRFVAFGQCLFVCLKKYS